MSKLTEVHNAHARSKIELWFFRDLSDDQRLNLFSIFGMPVGEIGQSQGHQRIVFRHILSKLTPAGRAALEQSNEA